MRRRLAGLFVVLVCAIALAGASWLYLRNWRPPLDQYPLQGIDVSEDSGAIDWPVARAAGADFAYIRATVGDTRRDGAFEQNWAAARAAGVRRGAIHLFNPCRPGKAQANNFIVMVPRVSDALPAAVVIDDAETACADPANDAPSNPPSRAALIEQLETFARMVESHTGAPILIQIAPAIEKRYDLARAFERPVWATRTYFTPGYLSRPWRMWRANAARPIEGVERPVGWDVVAP